jgi:hypothetical protein
MKFNFRKALLSGLCVTALGAMALPITASADVGIYLAVPPPPVRVEHVPPPRSGYIWAPGYWDVRGNHHVWHTGHWERERHGYYYAQPRWEQHDNRWELHRGHWERGDDDHDGVRNGQDRSPENPYRH